MDRETPNCFSSCSALLRWIRWSSVDRENIIISLMYTRTYYHKYAPKMVSIQCWKNPGLFVRPIVDTVSCSCPLCGITNAVFHLLVLQIGCWKNSLIISIDEKIV